MKTVLFILLCVSFPCFAAPATTGKHFNQDLSWPKLDSPETIIFGVQILKPEDFADIYKAFLDPIYRSDFYSVIHRIEIYTGSRDASQWTVDIYLETDACSRARCNSFHRFSRYFKSPLGGSECIERRSDQQRNPE